MLSLSCSVLSFHRTSIRSKYSIASNNVNQFYESPNKNLCKFTNFERWLIQEVFNKHCISMTYYNVLDGLHETTETCAYDARVFYSVLLYTRISMKINGSWLLNRLLMISIILPSVLAKFVLLFIYSYKACSLLKSVTLPTGKELSFTALYEA